MVTQHTDTYWTNSFGSRHHSQEAAEKDEALRSSRPFKLTCSPAGLHAFGSRSIEVAGPSNGVWGKSVPYWQHHHVYPLRDLVKTCQDLIDTYGENVGWMVTHQGNGHTGNVVVTWGPNPLYISKPDLPLDTQPQVP